MRRPKDRDEVLDDPRAMSLANGDAQRLNSSSVTWLGPVLTTICG